MTTDTKTEQRVVYMPPMQEHTILIAQVGDQLVVGGGTEVPFLTGHRLYSQPGGEPQEDGALYLDLDHRFGLTLPAALGPEKQDEIVEFIANAIAIGGGYPSIYYLDRKMPFRG